MYSLRYQTIIYLLPKPSADQFCSTGQISCAKLGQIHICNSNIYVIHVLQNDQGGKMQLRDCLHTKSFRKTKIFKYQFEAQKTVMQSWGLFTWLLPWFPGIRCPPQHPAQEPDLKLPLKGYIPSLDAFHTTEIQFHKTCKSCKFPFCFFNNFPPCLKQCCPAEI